MYNTMLHIYYALYIRIHIVQRHNRSKSQRK